MLVTTHKYWSVQYPTVHSSQWPWGFASWKWMFFVEKNKVPAYILPVLFVFCASKVGKLHLFRARFLDSGSRFVQNVTMRRFRTVFIALIESKNQVNPLKIRLSMTIFRNQPGTRFNKLLHNLYSTATATFISTENSTFNFFQSPTA